MPIKYTYYLRIQWVNHAYDQSILAWGVGLVDPLGDAAWLLQFLERVHFILTDFFLRLLIKYLLVIFCIIIP